MTGPDLLASGVDRPSAPGGRRRTVAVGGLLALVAGVVLLAARADPDPPPPAPVATAPTPTPTPTGSYPVYDLVITDDHGYLLARSCPTASCGYRILGWDGRTWTSTPLPIPPSTYPGRLLATGRSVAVYDGSDPERYVSQDGGRTFVTRNPEPADEVDRLPAGRPPEVVFGKVGFIDPRTAQFRRLTVQPMPGVAAAAEQPGRLRAVARSGNALVVATSTDRGRTWTRATVARETRPAPVLRVVPVPGTDAVYLVAVGPRPARLGLLGVWFTAGTGGWRAVTRPGQDLPAFDDVIGTADGLLLTDGTGGGWRLSAAGRFTAMTAAPGKLNPSILRPGPGGAVLALTDDRRHVLRTGPGGTIWTVLPLPR